MESQTYRRGCFVDMLSTGPAAEQMNSSFNSSSGRFSFEKTAISSYFPLRFCNAQSLPHDSGYAEYFFR